MVLFGAGSVGLITAMLLSWRVAAATRSVGEMARQLGEENDVGGAPAEPRGPSGPGEFADLAAELRQTSARLIEACTARGIGAERLFGEKEIFMS